MGTVKGEVQKKDTGGSCIFDYLRLAWKVALDTLAWLETLHENESS